jgi:hypothetical protein
VDAPGIDSSSHTDFEKQGKRLTSKEVEKWQKMKRNRIQTDGLPRVRSAVPTLSAVMKTRSTQERIPVKKDTNGLEAKSVAKGGC